MRAPLVLSCSLLALHCFARSGQVAERIMKLKDQGVAFRSMELFRSVPGSARNTQLWDAALNKADVLRFDRWAAAGVMQRTSAHISIELPFEGSVLQLDLARVEIGPEDAKVTLASGGAAGALPGAHFRGMVRGVPGSWAAISVFEDEVMGLINDGTGPIVLGELERGAPGLHVIYRDRELRKQHAFQCGTEDEGRPYRREELEENGSDRTIRCVRYYWEVNHNVFLDKVTLEATTTYITGLFNQSALMFDNDGIDIVLSELFVWDVPSPYTGPGSGDYLDQFGAYRTTFNGDMAHLVGYGGGGGVAYVRTLCSGLSRLRMAYSGISSSFSNVPTYSWSVEVTTHEAGHNLGSSHTHACVWNGNGTSIDGCGPTAGYPEGTCPTGPLPTGGGTVMSYCHLVGGVGINFNNGFGPQPTAVIRNAVNAATCLGVCGTTCDAPGNLSVSNLTLTTAQLNWANVGATSYDLQWRQVGAGTWNTVSAIVGNSHSISGLTQGTNYEFQVRSTCPSGTSSYSAVFTFTTPVPCPEALEPNNSLATAANITLPTTISALIAVNGDLDYYRFTTTGISTITMNLYGMPGDYDLRLLNSTGTTLAASEAGGTTAEYISYTGAPAGTYYAYVFGYNGAFSGITCYSLFVRTVAECVAPQGLAVNNITYNSGNVTWTTVPGAMGYDLRWKETGSTTWTDVSGLTAPPYGLGGLNWSTSYDVQVRSLCEGGVQGGSSSAYADTVTFLTDAPPCEVFAPIRVGLRVLLDGAYDLNSQLMHDSLRVYGLIPMQEPYTALGYVLDASATTTSTVLAVTGVDAIVDWVLVELREPAAPFTVLERRAGLLQRDGDVVNPDGTEFMAFCSPMSQPYHVSVRHRNHLGCMTATPVGLGPLPAPVYFPGLAAYGTNAQRERGGVNLLWAGNTVNDGSILYTGASNDRDAVLLAIGGVVATNVVSGYRPEDVNLDGRVKYSGSGNDRDVILNTIGGVIATNSVQEQLP